MFSAPFRIIQFILSRLFVVMNFNDCLKFIKLLSLFTAILFIACNLTASSSETKRNTARAEPTPPEATATPFSEPFTPYEADQFTNGLRETWQRFTASGQYRLAQPSDMCFPNRAEEAASLGLPENPIPFTYIWGDLNYKKRVDDNHLAVIVVDTTKTDDNRFSLVIFSPPEGKKDAFETHWFYRDRDLSKTTISRASGSFYIAQYFDDGTRESCSVAWNPKQKQFECERLK